MAVVMSVPHAFFEMYDSEKELQECLLFLNSVDEQILDKVCKHIERAAKSITFLPKLHPLPNMITLTGFFIVVLQLLLIAFKDMLTTQLLHMKINTFLTSLFDKYKITYEQTVKIGAALLIDYHQKQKRKFHLLQPIPFDHSNMKPNPDAHLTLTTMLEDIIIPSFRLSDSVVDIKLHCSYAFALFVSLFTIRARLACYYLNDPTFLSRLQTEDEDCYNEAYDLIESVLQQVQCTVDDCVEWAYESGNLCFLVSVFTHKDLQAMETKLKFEKQQLKFLGVIQSLQEDNFHRFSTVAKFSDLRNIDTSPKLRHLSNLPKFDAGTIVPIEPYQDMEPTRSFLVAAAQLRAFNYKNTLDVQSLFEPKHEFRFP
ncbi:hypothetical protein TYRP_017773, partial [Tyrophagus putrescentiae]